MHYVFRPAESSIDSVESDGGKSQGVGLVELRGTRKRLDVEFQATKACEGKSELAGSTVSRTASNALRGRQAGGRSDNGSRRGRRLALVSFEFFALGAD